MTQHDPLTYAYAAYTESIAAMLTELAAKLQARHAAVQARGLTQADVDEMHRIMLGIPEMD